MLSAIQTIEKMNAGDFILAWNDTAFDYTVKAASPLESNKWSLLAVEVETTNWNIPSPANLEF